MTRRMLILVLPSIAAAALLIRPAGAAPQPAAEPVQAAAQQEFAGLGLQLKADEKGNIEVFAVLEQASEEVKKAVKKGDRLVAVDGQPVKDKTVDEVAKKIRGEEGTTVKLTLNREGEEKPIEAKLTRRKIQLEK